MEEIDRVALALFDLAQGTECFRRMEECQKECEAIRADKEALRKSADTLEQEIIALDAKRIEVSKLIDASFPPEAKTFAETEFNKKYEQYFQRVQNLVEKHVIDARQLQVQTVVALAKAQEIEMEEIRALKGRQ